MVWNFEKSFKIFKKLINLKKNLDNLNMFKQLIKVWKFEKSLTFWRKLQNWKNVENFEKSWKIWRKKSGKFEQKLENFKKIGKFWKKMANLKKVGNFEKVEFFF